MVKSKKKYKKNRNCVIFVAKNVPSTFLHASFASWPWKRVGRVVGREKRAGYSSLGKNDSCTVKKLKKCISKRTCLIY